jgi:hypothetical protein
VGVDRDESEDGDGDDADDTAIDDNDDNDDEDDEDEDEDEDGHSDVAATRAGLTWSWAGRRESNRVRCGHIYPIECK